MKFFCLLSLFCLCVTATTYYVDPGASGANDGTSWTDAWQLIDSTQGRAGIVAAGDIIYCRGTQTLAKPIEFKSNSGSATGLYLRYIGCNAAGNVDGTLYVIDANGAITRCCSTFVSSYLIFQYIRFTGATVDNVDMGNNGGGDYNIFNQCWVDSAAGIGVYGAGGNSGIHFVTCKVFGNGGWGVSGLGADLSFDMCSFSLNAGGHINGASQARTMVSNSLLAPAAAGKIHLEGAGTSSRITGNVFDGTGIANDTAIAVLTPDIIIYGNRITNFTLGLDGEGGGNNRPFIAGWNVFANNTDDTSNVAQMFNFIDTSAGDLNSYGVSGDGYINDGAGNYNLSAGAAKRRYAVKLNSGKLP